MSNITFEQLADKFNQQFSTTLDTIQFRYYGGIFRQWFKVEELQESEKTFSEKILKLESQNKKLQRENELMKQIIKHYTEK